MTGESEEQSWIRRRAKVPRHIEAWLAVVVVACCVGSFVYRGTGPGGADPATGLMNTYLTVARGLPPDARIGFVSHLERRNDVGRASYIAQNAIAPRMLDAKLDAVSIAISTPDAPASLDGDASLSAFELVRVAAGGVRIYRRRE